MAMQQGCQVEIPSEVRFYRCKSRWNGTDGIAYEGLFATGTNPPETDLHKYVVKTIEIDCDWYLNGYDLVSATMNPYATTTDLTHTEVSVYRKSNGSTGHKGFLGVLVNVFASRNGGPNLADSCTNGFCDVLNLGCSPYDSAYTGSSRDLASDHSVYGQGKANAVGTGTGQITQRNRGARVIVIDEVPPAYVDSGSKYDLFIDDNGAAHTGGTIQFYDFGYFFRNSAAPVSTRAFYYAGASETDNYHQITFP